MARTNTGRLVTTGAVMARFGSASGSCFRAGASGLRAWGRRSAPAGDQKHVSDNPDRCRSDARRTPRDEFWTAGCHWIQRVARTVVRTENRIRVDDVIEPPAFPWDGAPGYMIRDRDRIYGAIVTRRLRAMGIRDKPTAPVSPWQNGFAERLIGSIRRE
jgi:hypothetical protein